jgi:hypothetical protein
MAVRKGFLQLGITLVNIAIVVLVFTSIWPFPSGEFKVDLPNTNDVQWSYSDGIIHVMAPFTVNNGWIYDVDDLEVSYSVTNQSGVMLADNLIRIGTLPAGRVTDSQIDFTFNITELYEAGGLGMIFQDDSLHFVVDVSCFYTMRLIEFEASYQADVPWDALIRDYGVTDISASGTTLYVDYFVETSPMLAPLGTVPMRLSVYDDGGNPLLYPPVVQSLQLGRNSSGQLAFTPTTAGAPPYEVHFEILGYEFVTRWP